MKKQLPINYTDLCVMCGMCTPHCPTYQVYQTETESPRGRIALMQALGQQQLIADKNLLEHLDHCLGCMACEAVCPSNVPFGQLIDQTKKLYESSIEKPAALKRLLRLNQKPKAINRYQKGLDLFHKTGLDKLVSFGLNFTQSKTAGLLKQIQATGLNTFYAADQKRGSVGLFTGCMGQAFDAETLLSSINLLNKLGFDVHIPENQYCCGALHQHNGFPDIAKELATNNQAIFKNTHIDNLLFTTTGCGSQLVNSELSVPVIDITSFILDQLSSTKLVFKPLQKDIVIHQGCHGRNTLGLSGISQKLLELIPEVSVKKIAQASLCCGAGGSNQITYPELAAELLSIKLDDIDKISPHYLVSDNLGCSLHFKTGFDQSSCDIEVIHPVTLLSKQLI
jgi:glycolate oxidase iron-sulfur subunit